ncbi:MAG: hypothetical protein H7Z39_08885, partial [Burkholderiaceae bacterium]|nr:hypothetical protein [Burkholderiaceae bacterium]
PLDALCAAHAALIEGLRPLLEEHAAAETAAPHTAPSGPVQERLAVLLAYLEHNDTRAEILAEELILSMGAPQPGWLATIARQIAELDYRAAVATLRALSAAGAGSDSEPGAASAPAR